MEASLEKVGSKDELESAVAELEVSKNESELEVFKNETEQILKKKAYWKKKFNIWSLVIKTKEQ